MTSAEPARYLAVDLGDRRTGLALGDPVGRIAGPLQVLDIPLAHRGGLDLLDAIARVADAELGPRDAIVIGLPLNMDGSEGPRAALTRAFAQRLGERTARHVLPFDERRSSLAAEARLARSGLTHDQKKRRRDAIAAAAILQAFFDAMPPTNDPAKPPHPHAGTISGDAW